MRSVICHLKRFRSFEFSSKIWVIRGQFDSPKNYEKKSIVSSIKKYPDVVPKIAVQDWQLHAESNWDLSQSPHPPQVRGIVHTTVLEIHRRHTRISIFLKFNNIIVDCKIWWKNSSLQYFFYTLMRDRYATVAIIFPWILHLYQMHDQNTLITLMTYILNQIIIAEKDLWGLASSTSRWKIL